MRLAAAVMGAVLATCSPASASLPVIFNDNLHQSAPGETDFTTPQLARAAAGISSGAILRFEVPWSGVEPYCYGNGTVLVWNRPPLDNREACRRPGPFEWNADGMESDLDSIAGYLESGQIRLLPMVLNAPTWAWGADDTPDPVAREGYDPRRPVMPPGQDPAALAWFGQFVSGLVAELESRYGRASLAGIEIWNEEDSYPVFWSSEPGADPARYAKVLCAGAWGAWRGDPKLPVLFGGFNPFDSQYLQAAYSSTAGAGTGRDIRTCMTAIGLHPYNVLGGEWVPPGTPGSPFAAGPATVAQVACVASDCGRPIWITEFGYPLNDPPTAQQQASWDAQAYTQATGTPGVQAMGIHSLFDLPRETFGVCAAPGVPRLAASELKQVVSGAASAIAQC